jgi:hypothetical protein
LLVQQALDVGFGGAGEGDTQIDPCNSVCAGQRAKRAELPRPKVGNGVDWKYSRKRRRNVISKSFSAPEQMLAEPCSSIHHATFAGRRS